MRRATFLWLGLWAIPAWASPLAHFPDWTLHKIHRSAEEGAQATGPDFFSLTGPGGKTATLDAATAGKLRRGDISPEQAMSAKADQTASGEEFVYGGSSRGYVVADDPLSGQRDAAASRNERPESSEESARPSSSFGGGGYGSSPTYASDLDGASSGSSTNGSTGASSAPSPAFPVAASAAPSTAAPASSPEAGENTYASAEPSVGSEADRNAPKDLNLARGIASNEMKFGEVGKLEPVKQSKSSPTSPISTGSGRPDPTELPVVQPNVLRPQCDDFEIVVDAPGIRRVALPEGCRTIRITAVGAGGGNASVATAETEDCSAMRNEWDNYCVKVPGSQTLRQTGGRGALASGAGQVDATKYDLLVVVGSPGQSIVNASGGAGGANGAGGAGGASQYHASNFLQGASNHTGGAGGGGYSGVFLVPKVTQTQDVDMSQALVVAGGGGGAGGYSNGAGGNGSAGNSGSMATFQGGGGQPGICLNQPGNACWASDLLSQGGGAGGGGGGGGYRGGLGGGLGGSGSGGSSHVLLSEKTIHEGGSAGYQNSSSRGTAGEPAAPGRVLIQAAD